MIALFLSLLLAVHEDERGSHDFVSEALDLAVKWVLFKKDLQILLLWGLLGLACLTIVALWAMHLEDKKKRRDLADELTQLRREHRKDALALEDQVTDLTDELETAKRHRMAMLNAMLVARDRVAVLHPRLAIAEHECTRLETSKRELTDKVEELKSKLREAQVWKGKASDLDIVVHEKKLRIKGLEQKLSQGGELQHAKKEAKKWRDLALTRIESRQDLYDTLENRAKWWQAHAAGVEKELGDCRAAFSRGKKEYEKLHGWSIDACKRGNKLIEELQIVEARLDTTKKELVGVKTEKENLKGALQAAIQRQHTRK